MVRSGPVARFAAYALFADVRFASRTERDRAGGVAFEACDDAGVGIAGLIEHSRGLRKRSWMHGVLAGRRTPGPQSGIVCRVMLHIPVFVDVGDERHCLPAGAES